MKPLDLKDRMEFQLPGSTVTHFAKTVCDLNKVKGAPAHHKDHVLIVTSACRQLIIKNDTELTIIEQYYAETLTHPNVRTNGACTVEWHKNRNPENEGFIDYK